MTTVSPLDVVELLGTWSAPDSHQAALAEEYIAFARHHDDAHLRAQRVGHFTASALIVDASARNALLTLHPTVGRWLQTGGHIEATDADLMSAATREAREESGVHSLQVDPRPLRLDRHQLMCRADDGDRTSLHHWDIQFLAVAADGAVPQISAESDDLRWWPLTDLPTDDDSVTALAAEALRRMRAVN